MTGKQAECGRAETAQVQGIGLGNRTCGSRAHVQGQWLGPVRACVDSAAPALHGRARRAQRAMRLELSKLRRYSVG